MARPIKLFQFTQKLYRLVGLYPPQSNINQSHSFNVENYFIIFTLAQMSILSGAFFLFEAKRLDEFGVSFHDVTTIITDLFYFISTLYQMENILKFIEQFEELIGESE